MFVLPGRIPWVNLGEKLLAPIYLPGVLAYLVIPLGAVGVFGIFRQRAALPGLPLPVWMFLASVPWNLAGFATAGGNLNSFHAANFLLPLAFVHLVARERFGARPRSQGACVLMLVALLGFQVSQVKTIRFVPQVEALRQGLALARQLPDEVYFPWNPLLNFEVAGRFDRVEDGIITRGLAGHPLTNDQMHRHLPPRVFVVARQGLGASGILNLILIPAHAQSDPFGQWTLTHWPLPPAPDAP